MMLADYGADVVRVERPSGAPDRLLQSLGDDEQGGATYRQYNRGKKSLTLDIFSPDSRPIIDGLLMRADVVIANVTGPTLAAMGLEYDRLVAINPRLILVTCSAYSPLGAWADVPGFDGIGQAMSGAADMAGCDGEPRKAYAHWVDHLTAAHMAFGVLAALRERERSGQGQQVHGCLLGTALFAMAGNLGEEAATGVGRRGTGNRAQIAGPADIFKTLDGSVLVQTVGNSLFARAARVFGHEEWLTDPRFASDELRGQNTAQLAAVVAPWCAARTTNTCVEAFRAYGVPAAAVLTTAQVLVHPETRRGDFWSETADPAMPIARNPIRMSLSTAREPHAAPRLGADNDLIVSLADQ